MENLKVKDKVYVKDWGKQYISIFDNKGEYFFGWKTKIPSYSNTDFHFKCIYKDNLTLKGTINKREPQILVERVPEFKNFQYVIEEMTTTKDNALIYLLSSKQGCWVQIGENGISTLTLKEQNKVKHLENEERLQCLAFENLSKWDINVKKSDFPKELLKYLYDTNQNTLFGSVMTKAIIKYPYIAKEYTVNGNDICLGWEQNYNGVGCDLTDKNTISWNELKERFPENKFE